MSPAPSRRPPISFKFLRRQEHAECISHTGHRTHTRLSRARLYIHPEAKRDTFAGRHMASSKAWEVLLRSTMFSLCGGGGGVLDPEAYPKARRGAPNCVSCETCAVPSLKETILHRHKCAGATGCPKGRGLAARTRRPRRSRCSHCVVDSTYSP